MLYFLDYNKKVAWNASALGIVAFAAECECLAFGCARSDLERDFLVFAYNACAAAVSALLGDYLAGTATGGALCHRLLYAEDCLLLHGDVSAAVATVAGGESHAVFGAGALAVLALYECGHTESLGDAFCNVFKRQLHTYAYIASSALTRLTAAAFCTAESSEVKSGTEYAVEDIVDVEATGISAAETTRGRMLRFPSATWLPPIA